jgi:molybdenum cofactor synthesis domain-containing protein
MLSPTGNKTPTAAVLIIGNEILSGRTQDANLSYIAQKLGEIGVAVREVRVVPDIEGEIIAAVNDLRARYDHVFTTGGIGPTHDDITSFCIAKAFGLPLELNEEALDRLTRHYPTGKLNEARRRMAMIPPTATLIDNPISAAPGFRLENVYVLPGVPRIMQAMLDGLLPFISGGPAIRSRIVATALLEGTIAADLGAVQDAFPDIDIGSYPYFRAGAFGVSLVLRGTDINRLEAATQAVVAMIEKLGGTGIVTDGSDHRASPD